LDLIRFKHREVPIVLCSAQTASPDSYFLNRGANAVLRKPFDSGKLLETLESALKGMGETTTVQIKGYNLQSARDAATRKLIIKAMGKTSFNASRAADLLGITRQTLMVYMKRFEIAHYASRRKNHRPN
jgi:DNA-binding NtrC family response regulator